MRRKPAEPAPRAEVSLQIPLRMFERIQAQAAACGVPYEDLIKVWLGDKLAAE